MKVLKVLMGAALLVLWLLPGGLLVVSGRNDLAVSVWSAIGLWALGVKTELRGESPGAGLVAANHASYLDIFVLGRHLPGFFIAKHEIAGWPLIGLSARVAGVLFIERDRAKRASGGVEAVTARLNEGGRVLLFPEGGIPARLDEPGPFRPMFFEAAIRSGAAVHPVRIDYRCRDGQSAWAWTDGAGLFEHLVKNLLPAGRITAVVTAGKPLKTGPGTDRKTLAESCRRAIIDLESAETP